VDYLGLMNSARLRPGMVNSYELIKSITAELRSVAQTRDLKIFTAAQLNRSAVGNLEAGQESVADSAGISAFSDGMIFFLQTKEMKELGEIIVNFEKNRYDGKTYSIKIGFDYTKMKFIELNEPEIKTDEYGLPEAKNSFRI
jgi:replicative DNA helicase